MTKHCLLVKGGGAQIHHKGKSLPGNIIGVQKAAWFLLLSSLVMISLPGLFLIQWSSPVRVGPGGVYNVTWALFVGLAVGSSLL